MSGLIDSLLGLQMAATVLLLGMVALVAVPLFVQRLALAWARFWCAVIIAVYLNRPWRVARDRARREIY